MKIGIISDLHFDLYEKEGIDLLNEMKEYFKDEREIEVLIVAGDISESFESTSKFIKDLKKSIGRDVYYVPGNHDLWQKTGEVGPTIEIIEKYKGDENCLLGKSIKLSEDSVVIGHTGWYDYSFGSRDLFKEEEFQKGQLGERTWQDKIRVDFQKSDTEIHREFLDEMKKSFEENTGKKIIFVTHMINHPGFSVSTEGKEIWHFFNGFLGSRDYYELCRKYKPAIAVSGHVHYRKTIVEDGTTYICSCLGYHKEFDKYRGTASISENIKDSIKIVEV